MIDTIRIRPIDYTIADSTPFIIHRPPAHNIMGQYQCSGPMLYTTDSGRYVFGDKAYYNANGWKLDIKPLGRDAHPYMFITLSVPKFLDITSNYRSVTADEFYSAMRSLNADLNAHGIYTSINEACISRVDLFKNIILDEPYHSYIPLIDAMTVMRAKRKIWGTTYLWKTNIWEISIYDKIDEMKSKGMPVSGLPDNVVRFELRLMRAQEIKEKLGVMTVDELYGHFDLLEEYFNNTIKDKLFATKAQSVPLSIEATVADYRERYSKNWLRQYLRDKGVQTLLSNFNGDVGATIAMLENSEMPKSTIRIFKKDCERIKRDSAIAGISMAGKPMDSLYNELFSKLFPNLPEPQINVGGIE
ncbi:MAG: hypothetical protein WC074_05425 [bacterium]